MGFYLGSARTRLLLDDFSPTITPGEYIAALSAGLRSYSRLAHCDCCDIRLLVRTLSHLMCRYPNDSVAHRMLGVAYFHAGRLSSAARHLETALALLKRDASDHSTLTSAIRIQLDAALIRVALLPIYASRGQHAALRRLANEALGLFPT
jgi:hypothetical protein